jgi:hypothetical protein
VAIVICNIQRTTSPEFIGKPGYVGKDILDNKQEFTLQSTIGTIYSY